MLVTNKDLNITFKEEELNIPKGTRVTNNTALGFDPNYNFIDEFSWYKPELTGFARKMALHDMIYYGVNVSREHVEKV